MVYGIRMAYVLQCVTNYTASAQSWGRGGGRWFPMQTHSHRWFVGQTQRIDFRILHNLFEKNILLRRIQVFERFSSVYSS